MVRAREAALLATSTVRAFGGALPPTMPSADFCVAVRSPYDDFSPVTGTQRRPPEVRPTAFAARPPDLPPRPLMTVDFAIICSLVRPGRPRYPVLVHRAAALLHASFRPRLAATPLRFANPSPPSGWIEDLHLRAIGHARHTKKRPPEGPAGAGLERGRGTASSEGRSRGRTGRGNVSHIVNRAGGSRGGNTKMSGPGTSGGDASLISAVTAARRARRRSHWRRASTLVGSRHSGSASASLRSARVRPTSASMRS